jgi:tripeptidyl-peptidase-1
MISLVNSARFRKGLGPIGWLNPLLYQYADRFANDITVGDNFCVASQDDNPVCCEQGFKAARGWDPVTGLGSVDFDKLLPLLSSADIHTSSR